MHFGRIKSPENASSGHKCRNVQAAEKSGYSIILHPYLCHSLCCCFAKLVIGVTVVHDRGYLLIIITLICYIITMIISVIRWYRSGVLKIIS